MNVSVSQTSGKAIVIVGLMGSGKSTVGAKVARNIGAQFIDTDDLVASRSGRTVRDIFSQDGEVAFRAAEESALHEAFKSVQLGQDLIISTGGGIVLSPNNRDLIKRNATRVFWLDAPIEDLVQRTSNATKRPLLDGDARGTLATMAKDRFPLYQEVATVRIDTRQLSVADVAQRITDAISEGVHP